MEKSIVKVWIIIAAVFCAFGETQGINLRLQKALTQAGAWLNDVDGDNIPGQAGTDYPVHSSVPEGTSFRCQKYEYAGYFADVEADCQAYHVCFPDGRNASFLCVNGTVFHQRYFVCDWWFHSNCSLAPEIYELNLYRKIPLPVLPPVQRRVFPGPAPQPEVQSPRPPSREPKNMPMNLRNQPNQRNKENDPTQRSPNDRVQPKDERKPPNERIPSDGKKPPNERIPSDGKKPNDGKKPFSINPIYPGMEERKDDNCNCQCGNSPAAKYAVSAVQYENTIHIH